MPMPYDPAKFSKEIVAITYPQTGKPALLQSSYNENMWAKLVVGADLQPKTGAFLVHRETPEGQAILRGTPAENMTDAYLMGLTDEDFASLCDEHKVKVGKNKQATVLKLLAAIEEQKNATMLWE